MSLIDRANAYSTDFSYDAMGNITDLKRNGSSTQPSMDDLQYNYKLNSNQLDYVDDAVSASNYSTDIDDQMGGNFQYDEIGNLISDVSEQITDIEWTVYGKIAKIERDPMSDKADLEFEYTPDGHRSLKRVYFKNPGGGGISHIEETFYIRDASGNMMATYVTKNSEFTWESSSIYGSSRLGVVETNVLLVDNSGNTVISSLPTDEVVHFRGKKRYELSNHLGNVLAVVSDKRTQICVGGNQHYEAEIIVAQDYYPFGMQISERSYSATIKGYRFGFNGQEGDDEVKGSGNSLDFGDRIYDPRLGRWMSVDPLFKIYPEISPYAYCANNPIRYKEVDGRGFNGGFSVENQSSKPIVVVGTSKTITTDANGNKVENESPATEVTLQPGERLEVYYTKTKDKSGNVTEKYTAKVVTASDGKVVKGKEDINAWDVDFIKVQKGQTFEDSDGNTYNTDPNDKSAKTPNPPTGEGTIKVRPSVFDYNPDKDDANEGKVIIKDGSNGNLNVETGGEWENEPSVNYGDGKKK